MISIVDYGMGNLRSVEKALEKLGCPARISDNPTEVRAADGVILPGVGAFADAMRHLTETGLADAVLDAIGAGRPFLGICLGLQLLFTTSFEDGRHPGLGVIEGMVERLPDGVKVPHMGWNQVRQVRKSPLFEGVPDSANFYFVHSYAGRPAGTAAISAVADYGGEVTAGVWKDNVHALQFHPEKSGDIGLAVLNNFARMCR